MHGLRSPNPTLNPKLIGAMMDCDISITTGLVHSSLNAKIEAALNDAIAGIGKLPDSLLSLRGMSGRKYRLFVNNLISILDDARYLEVGILTGSTLCSAIFGNRVLATAIDNWSQFGAPKLEFLKNLESFRGPQAEVRVMECDFRKLDFSTIGTFNVYLFDGPHELDDQRDAIERALPALDKEFVLIVDDWNWHQVREGTLRAIESAGFEEGYRAEIRTTRDGSHGRFFGAAGDWHNGYFVASLRKI
jgi:SAM-dependent methyltransferase